MNKTGLQLALVLIVLVVGMILFPLERFLLQIQSWSDNYPYLAVWIVGLAFFLGVVLLLPVSPIVMAAGFLFGLAKGLVVIWCAGFVASSLTFWLSRNWARQWVEQKMRSRPVFMAIDGAIGRNGFWIVLLSRLAMVFPYGPLNYSLGLSSLRFRDFLFGTNFGMIPPFLFVLYIGSTASSITALLNGQVQLESRSVLLGIGILALLATVAAIITRTALKILRSELAAPDSEHSD